MVTHDPRYALHADRAVKLFDGRVVEETSKNDPAAASVLPS
jgi:ABC-type siderophore export system fused ATPase/permease subunit